MTTVVIGFGVTFLIASTSPFVSAALPWPSATSTPRVGDDEHVGGREFLGPGVEIFVGVDVVGDLDRARKVGQLHAALDRIGGADDRRLRVGGRRGDRESDNDGFRSAGAAWRSLVRGEPLS